MHIKSHIRNMWVQGLPHPPFWWFYCHSYQVAKQQQGCRQTVRREREEVARILRDQDGFTEGMELKQQENCQTWLSGFWCLSFGLFLCTCMAMQILHFNYSQHLYSRVLDFVAWLFQTEQCASIQNSVSSWYTLSMNTDTSKLQDSINEFII